MLGNDSRKNIFSEIVMRFRILGISEQDRNQQLRIENVNSHRCVALARIVRRFFGLLRLLFEADDAPVFVHFDYAKLLCRFMGGNLDGANGHVRGGLQMLLQHLGVIHFVNVIAGKNENVFRSLAADGINVLIYGVGSSLIPLFRNAHLRRQDLDVLAQPRQRRPAGAHMPAQTQRLVLRQHKYPAKSGIHAIRKGDVDDAVRRAKRYCGLGAISGHRPQPLALPTSQQHHNGIAHVLHGVPPRVQGFRACTYKP